MAFFLDKPYSFLSTTETAGLYEYLYKMVEKMNIELNDIDPDQLNEAKLKEFIQKTTGITVDVPSKMTILVSGSNNFELTITVRKKAGIVFLTVGDMAYVPVNTDTDLTVLPKPYWPTQTEYCDYQTPSGEKFRLTVAENGTVTLHNYGTSLSASIDSHIRMSWPAV